MKTYTKLFTSFVFVLAFFSFAGLTYAKTPSLDLSENGGDEVTVEVDGDANSSVFLYYNLDSGIQSSNIGRTSSSGFLSEDIDSSDYGIIPGEDVYVIVNNRQSSREEWPDSFSSDNDLDLSDTRLTMHVGDTEVVTIYDNNYYNNYRTYYIYDNSKESVADAYVSGNAVYIDANKSGTTTIEVCERGHRNNCGEIRVTVSGSSTSSSTGGFIISSMILSVGDSITLASPNSGSIYISSNSNPNVASTYANSLPPGCTGNYQYSSTTGERCYQTNSSSRSVTITALSYGSTNITLCQNSSRSNCNIMYITVGNTGIYPYPQVYPTYPTTQYYSY